MKKFFNRIFRTRFYMVSFANRHFLYSREFWQLVGEPVGVDSTDRQYMVWLVDYMNGGR